jgi:hypothetical protein
MKKFCLIGFENSSGVKRRPRGAPIIMCKNPYGDTLTLNHTTFEWYKASLNKRLILKWELDGLRKYCSSHWSTKDPYTFICSDGTILHIVPYEEISIIFAELKLRGKNNEST